MRDQTKGKILIVDDEEMFLFAQSRLLTRMGYQVFKAESGMRAVEIFEEEKGALDLIILDLVMPEMDGAETFEALRRIDPAARVLLCSGYSRKGIVSALLNAGALGFVQKPFDSDELLGKISSLLAAPS